MNSQPVAIVTGAAGGIGAATCIELAKRGYHLALIDLPETDLQTVAQAVQDAGSEALVLPGDIVDLHFDQHCVERTAEQWGRIDLLVNNAAWREITTMSKISPESWDKTLRICLTAPAFFARWCAEHMKKQKCGVIINISSVVSRVATGSVPAYTACKGALDALTSELSVLYGSSGIRVVSLRPGAIDTEMCRDYTSEDGASATEALRSWSNDMIPLRRWGTPQEVARTIAWLASDDATYITGTNIVADGGLETQLSPYSLKKIIHPSDAW
jgi:NAD(P)-dependent dehydrogenase (short-subunit alcohol dehydrogenase family)